MGGFALVGYLLGNRLEHLREGNPDLGLLARAAGDEELDGFRLLETGNECIVVIRTEVLGWHAGFLRVELVGHGRGFTHEFAGILLNREVLGNGRRMFGAKHHEREGNLVGDGVAGIVVGHAGSEAGSRTEQAGGQCGQQALAGLAVMVDVGVAKIGAEMRYDAVRGLEARFLGVARFPGIFPGIFRKHHGHEVVGGTVRALVEVRRYGTAYHVAHKVDEVTERIGDRVFAARSAGTGIELQLFNDGTADKKHGNRGGRGGGRSAPCGYGIGHGFHRGDEQRHMFGLGSGHNAERSHQFNGQHALTGRNDPEHFSGVALGALKHGLHLVHGGRNDGQGKRPLALLEHLVHIRIGAGELEGLGGIGFYLSAVLLPGRLPLSCGLDDVVEGCVHLGVDFGLGDHAQRMRNRHEAHVG